MRSTKEILNEVDSVELNTLNKESLKKLVSRLKRTASQRLKRLDSKGIKVKKVKQAMRRLHKNDDLNTLREQFSYLSKFLNRKTSTIRGYNEWSQNVERAIGAKLNKRQRKKLFRLKSRAEELPVGSALGSKELMKTLGDYVSRNKNKSVDDMLNELDDYLKKKYEEQQEDESDVMEDSDYGGGNKFSM